jgi:phosphoglycolate phosphatase
MTRCLVLDLDGTLVDSAPDLAAALNRLMAARDLPPFTLPEVARMVGDGVRALLERAFAARDGVPDAQALRDYMADYAAHVADATRPYPGVAATLEALAARGWRLAVCTNKPEALAHAVLSATGLAGFFAAVGGGDSFPARKPDPAHLLATLAAAGAAPGGAVMAGDHRNDILAATGAGVPCIFAAWGYGPAAMGAGAAAVAGSFGELVGLAERLLPG